MPPPALKCVLARQAKTLLLGTLKKLKLVPDAVKDVSQASPLELPQADTSADRTKARKVMPGTSYKEMWRKSNARLSLTKNSVYEAGGSALWASFCPADKVSPSATEADPSDILAGDVGTWHQLQTACGLFKPSVEQPSRMMWPVTLQVACRSIDEVCPPDTEYPKTLKLLCNHVVLGAWWIKMYEALQASDDNMVAMLWECALTCTIRVTLWVSDVHVVKIAMSAAEESRTLEELNEDLVTFAYRLGTVTKQYSKLTIPQILDKLKADRVTWMGKPVTKNHMAACELFVKCLSARSRKLLSALSSKHGRKFLLDGPTKLYRIIVAVNKFVASSKVRLVASDVLEMVLACLATALESTSLTAEACTSPFLTGKEGSKVTEGTWCGAALTGIAVGQQARNVIALMQNDAVTEDFKQTVEVMVNPVLWRQELIKKLQDRVSVFVVGLSRVRTLFCEAFCSSVFQLGQTGRWW